MTEQLLVLNPRPESYLSLLDEKSIGKVCEHLDLYDLLQFGELDMNYQRIIGEHIISKRTLNMSEISKHYPVRDVFRHYGEFMTELSIKESDIQYKGAQYTHVEEIFRLIKKRCVAGKLESVIIRFDGKPKDVNANVFLDVFKELKSLTIIKPETGWNFTRDKPLEELLEKLLVNCPDLCSLKLQNLSSGVDFLLTPRMHNLKSLWLVDCLIRYDSLVEYIEAGHHSLESLKITSTLSGNDYFDRLEKDLGAFLRQIVNAFPLLEKLALSCSSFINQNYESLARLHQLKAVRIYDSGNSNWLSSLANPHLVEELAVRFHESPELPVDISAFTNLRSVEFHDPIKAHLNVYKSFVALPQLTECVLSVSAYPITDAMDLIVLAIVMTSERLQTLKVSSPYPSFTSAFYNDLVKKRERIFPNAPPLHLYAKFQKLKRYSPKVIKICSK